MIAPPAQKVSGYATGHSPQVAHGQKFRCTSLFIDVTNKKIKVILLTKTTVVISVTFF